jgi:anti-sigma factor RsiW
MNAMTCASGVDLLMEYLEGTLAEDVRAAIEAHVTRCHRCALTTAEIPADLAASLLAHLRARRREPPGEP